MRGIMRYRPERPTVRPGGPHNLHYAKWPGRCAPEGALRALFVPAPGGSAAGRLQPLRGLRYGPRSQPPTL